MPIRDLEMMQRQLGRIRTGDRVATKDGNSTRPHKLDKFRFTSPNKHLIDAAAALYGGEPRPWDNDGKPEFEVYSQVSRVPILVPPKNLTQWYELHTAAGCQRRCDGITNIIDDTPCKCPKDGLERALLAQSGRACKPTTRLNVVLEEMPGIGVWRVDSHGYHSATKLPTVAELLAYAAGGGRYIPAHLVLELQTSKRPGEGRREWYVPLIDVGVSPRELMAGSGERGIAQLSGAAPTAIGRAPRAIEAAKPAVPAAPGGRLSAAQWMTLADGAKTLDELTVALKGAQADGFAKNGDANDEVFARFAARRRAITTAGRSPQADAQPEVVDAEIVDSDELDELWASITEEAPGWDRVTLEREFAAFTNGATPTSADAQQMRGFLAFLRRGSAVAA